MPIAPDVVAGAVRTDVIASQKVPVYMDEFIAFEDETAYRFESLFRRLNGFREVNNMKVEFMEMGLYPTTMTVNTAAAAAATEVYVDHPEYAHTDQYIYNTRTHGAAMMNEVTGGGTTGGAITVLGLAGSGGIPEIWAVGDILKIGPELHAEGEKPPAAFSAKPRFLFTYLFQSDKKIGPYTDIQRNQGEYGENQLDIDRRQAWVNWKTLKNVMCYFGQQTREVTSASGPRRHSMKGLRSWIVTNRMDFSTTSPTTVLGMASVGEILRQCSIIGASSGMKIGIAGQNAWVGLSALPATAIRATQKETSWGWKISEVVTPFGNLALEYDPTLTDVNGLADVMVVLDAKSIKMLYYKGLRERMYLNVQDASDIHNIEDAISGTMGMEMKLEELNAWVEGVR